MLLPLLQNNLLAGGGTTIEVPSGAVLYTGQIPTVTATANQSVEIPAGALLYTGQVPTIFASDFQSVEIPAGSVVYTGQIPTVIAAANKSVEVPAGSVIYTGQTPTVIATANQSIEVPAGAVLYTGQVPTVAANNNKAVEVPAGAVLYTGQTPTIVASTNQIIEVPAGSVLYTGQVPTVTSQEIADDEEANTGGSFAFMREQLRYKEEDEARQRKAKREASKKIADPIDRELALAERAIEEGEAERANLERLTELANRYKDEISVDSVKIKQSIEDAVYYGTFSRMQKLSRELRQVYEEEQFMLLATEILLSQWDMKSTAENLALRARREEKEMADFMVLARKMLEEQ